MKIDATQTEPQKPAETPRSPDGSEGFPDTLLSLIGPSSDQAPPGPEPPGSPGSSPGSEEAAKLPNAPSQKLDSPKTAPDPNATAANSSALAAMTAPACNGAILLAQVSQPASFVDTKVAGSAPVPPCATFAASQLPLDKEVPIVQLRAFGPTSDQVSQFQAELENVHNAFLGVVQNASKVMQKLGVQIDAAARDFASVKAESTPLGNAKAPIDPTRLTQGEKSSPNPTPQEVATSSKVLPIQAFAGEEQNPTASSKSVTGKSVAISGLGTPDALARASATSSNAAGQQSGQQFPSPAPHTQTTHALGKPAELGLSQNLDRAALVSQVANKLEALLAARPKGGVTIELAPKALGNITVTIKSVGRSVDTQIAASNADVRSALQQSRPELVQAVQSRGYIVSNVSISSHSDPSAGNHPSKEGRPDQSGSSKQLQFDQRPLSEAVHHSSSRFKNSSGVDLWI